MKRQRRLTSLALIALLVASSSATSTLAASAATASGPCDAHVVIIGVRGTNAPEGSGLASGGRVWTSGGFGSNVTPVIEKLRSEFPIDLKSWVVSLNYPAKAEVNLIDTSNSYISSRDSGVATLSAELESYSSCAIRPMVLLIGYSQGADVVSTTLGSAMNTTARGKSKAPLRLGTQDIAQISRSTLPA